MTGKRAAAIFRKALLLILLMGSPLAAWAVDTDGDGIDDSMDAFPTYPEATTDTDGDGSPNSIVDANIPVFEDFEAPLVGWTLSTNMGRSTWKKFRGAYSGGNTSLQSSGTLSKSASVRTIVYNTSALPPNFPVRPFKVDGIQQTPACVQVTPLASQSSTYAGSWYQCKVVVGTGVHILEWTAGHEWPQFGSAVTYAVDDIRLSTLVEDTDDDNDGVPDISDAFPLDPSEQLDTDFDGTGNNADLDDDNDGVLDTDDALPLNPSEWLDTDIDGIGNNADDDDDNDGVPDYIDAEPLNAGNASELILPIDGGYKGSAVRDGVTVE